MATLEELIAEKKRREAAQAERLAKGPTGISANAQAIDEFRQKGGAAVHGAKDMATLGLNDELAGVRAVITGGTPQNDGTIDVGNYSVPAGERYAASRDAYRAAKQQAQESEPNAYAGGQVFGGAVQSALALPAATGKTLFGTMLRGAGVGAVEGGTYGAGSSDGGDIVADAKRGATVGALVGAGAPALVAGAQGAYRMAKDPITGIVDALTNKANQKKANRALVNALKQSGQSADDVSSRVALAAREGQADYRIMDALGVTGQRRASGMVRSGGASADELTEFLQRRGDDAKDRVLGFTDEAFGMQGRTAQSWRDTVDTNRKQVADSLYTQAAETADPVDVRNVVSRLDETIGQMTNSGIAPPAVVKEFQKLRKKLAGMTAKGEPTTLSDYQSVRQIWQEVRDTVDKYYTRGSGKTNVAAELKPIRDMMEQALSESSDLFSFANANYRAGGDVLQAFDTGADAAKRGRPADNIAAFNALPEQQQRAARIGYGDAVSESIERNKAVQPNAAREFASTKREVEAAAMATDPALLQRRLQRENEMFGVQQRALGGSKTADNLEDIAGAQSDAQGAMQIARSVGNLNIGDAAMQTASALAPYAKGQNEATRQLIARALMSKDPQAVLGPAMKQDRQNETARRLIEALLRSTGRAAAIQ